MINKNNIKTNCGTKSQHMDDAMYPVPAATMPRERSRLSGPFSIFFLKKNESETSLILLALEASRLLLLIANISGLAASAFRAADPSADHTV